MRRYPLHTLRRRTCVWFSEEPGRTWALFPAPPHPTYLLHHTGNYHSRTCYSPKAWHCSNLLTPGSIEAWSFGSLRHLPVLLSVPVLNCQRRTVRCFG